MPTDAPNTSETASYRGRLAPTPTGHLHLGHARTFWIAQQRALAHRGTLVLRIEDLDRTRCKIEFVTAMMEDLGWFEFQWQEGLDCGGPFAPYVQSERHALHQWAFEKLKSLGLLFPCTCSRKDIQSALQAPHTDDDELIYPGTCRNRPQEMDEHAPIDFTRSKTQKPNLQNSSVSWRFRVPDGETFSFVDGNFGPQQFVAGKDFGDFVVWRQDHLPSYQLAVVVDDAAMKITEVVRGADLLKSTARQLLLYRALGFAPPAFYHCPLMTDDSGIRLAKRHGALSLRSLRERGETPDTLRRGWADVRMTSPSIPIA